MKYVNDAVATNPVGQTFHFVNGSNSTGDEYTYDANGNLTKDLNRNITDIQYNLLNLPKKLQLSTGGIATYVYDATGVKRQVSHQGAGVSKTTDYCGSVIYENGTLSKILTEEGYITLSGTTPTYHYYLKDHLGNNRVVLNQNGTTVEQVNHYYPFGGLFDQTSETLQAYKYNGKELDRTYGIDLYDYSARYMDGAVGRFTTMDPLAEKYYSVSPYAYVMNNPMRFVDPDGREVIALDEESRRNILNTLTKNEAKYVRFSKDGLLDSKNLNKSKSNSENMTALKTLANSEISYKFIVTDKDIDGDSFSFTYKGLTAIPGEKEKGSSDNDVWIMTSSFLDEKSQAQNVAHEAYGHGYFYELNRIDRSYDYHHRYINVSGEPEWDSEFNVFIIPNIRTESNIKLKKQIDITTKQASINYESRKKK